MKTLQEIREKLLKEKDNSGGNFTKDNSIFAHWNIPDNSRAVLRFLPDGDAQNDFFWKERLMIKLPFQGVKGQDEQKEVTVQVPCVEMWGSTCPVLKEIRPWFKNSEMEDMARSYWKKRSYLFQGFVVSSSLEEDDEPESPIRRFVISPQIFKIIKSALMDPEFGDYLPTDYENGVDFIIKKEQNGQYSDYTTSDWSRRSRALTEIERTAIDEWGLYDLNDFMPPKPTTEQVDAIFELFRDSVEDKPYDLDKYGEYYRPWGLEDKDKDTETTVTPRRKVVSEETVEKASTPDEEKSVSDSDSEEMSQDTKDILARIRNRKSTDD